MYEIKQLKTHVWGSRNRSVPLLVVLHISNCDMDYLNEYYTSEHNQEASAHFAVSRTGEITQYADIKERTFHASLPNELYKESRVAMVKNTKKLNPNYYSIGIVFEGYGENGGDGELTDDQFWAGVWLMRFLRHEVIERYSRYIELNPKQIVGHCDVDPTRQANCPGLKFPFERLYKELEYVQKLSLEELEARFQYVRNKKDVLAGINSALYKLNEYRTAYLRPGRWHLWGEEKCKKVVEVLEKEGIL